MRQTTKQLKINFEMVNILINKGKGSNRKNIQLSLEFYR
jgi:hypothetical protein